MIFSCYKSKTFYELPFPLVVVDTVQAEMYLDSSVPSEQTLYLFYCLKEMASWFTFILQDFLRLALGKPFGIAEMFSI